MKYVSTRDDSKEFNFEDVFIKGLADDGGLYVPTSLKKFNNETWNDSIIKLHDPKNIANYKSNFYKRLAYDEILSTFLVNSEVATNTVINEKNSFSFLLLGE